ncbi:MAG: DUF177 domain-containing protein [Pseudomonadota bacterium]
MSKAGYIQVRELSQQGQTTFTLTLSAEQMSDIQSRLGLLGLKKCRLNGQIAPHGNTDWLLSASLGASVTQACVVTLDPVLTRVEAPVERLYMREVPDFSQVEEAQMPEDDRIETLPEEIDLARLFEEALALNIPLYPRKDTEGPMTHSVTEPGKTPMTNEEAKPFAGLANLRDRLKDES